MEAPELSRPRGRDDPRRRRRTSRSSSARSRRRPSSIGHRRGRRCSTLLRVVQGAQADAPVRRGDEPPQRGLQGQRDGRVGGARGQSSTRSGPRMAGLRVREPLLPAARPTRTGRTRCSRWCTGTNARDCEETIAAIRAETGVDEYALLWSVKEYKKTRVRYFTAEWDEWRAEHLAPAARASHAAARRAGGGRRPTAVPSTAATRAVGDRTRTRVRRRRWQRRRAPRGSPPRSCAAGCQPSARRRSLATTHGCTRYGTTLGGTSPSPLAHSRAQHALEQLGRAAAGTSERGQQRPRVVGVEPAVGGDVERARDGPRARPARARRRGRRRAPPAPAGRRPATRSGGRPSSRRDGSRSAPAPSTGAVRSVVTVTAGVLVAPLARAAARPRPPGPRARSRGWAAAARPR